MARRVAVVGVGQTKHGRRDDVNYQELIYEATRRALDDAELPPGELEALVCGSMPAPMEGVNAPHLWLAEASILPHKPVLRVATCGSTGISLAHSAYYHIASGLFDVVVALGAEKMYENDPQGAMTTVAEPLCQRAFLAGAPGIFALQCNEYIHRFGLDERRVSEAAAMISVRNHNDALDNPYAHIRRKITLEEAMGSRMISHPVRLLDVCPISDGACAVIFASEEKARKITDNPAWVKGLAYRGDEQWFAEKDLVKWASAVEAARESYRMAGIEKPLRQIDVAEVYNPFTFQELLYYECFGFCGWGEGSTLVEEGVVGRGGSLPCDPSGGVLCTNPIGAAGLLRVAEAALQVKGEAGSHQIPHAETALAHAMGGLIQFNGVMILGKTP